MSEAPIAIDPAEPPPAPASAEALRAQLDSIVALARASGVDRFAVLRTPAPAFDALEVFAASEGQTRGYFAQATARRAMATRGCVARIEVTGAERLRDAREALAALFARVHVLGDAAAGSPAPRVFGGFAFTPAAPCDAWAGFPDGALVLPAATFIREADAAWWLHCVRVGPDACSAELAAELSERIEADMRAPQAHPPRLAGTSCEPPFEAGAEYRVQADRPHAVYAAQVDAALAAIGRAEFEKVVLARSLAVAHPGRFELKTFLERLRSLYPTCTIMAVGAPGAHVESGAERILVAASPERLVRLAGERVETGALAGSAPRGRSPEEDARLGAALRESKKEQAEHEAVVSSIRAALREPCGELEGAEAPELMQIEGIQHLHTPLVGRLRSGAVGSVLDLVDRLHPTPAVAGLPREPALAWLAEHEGLERGWYAGPVGFVDALGQGEFWLALRSGLIENPTPLAAGQRSAGERVANARLFAGAGIVQGSRAEAELAETRLKLRALLAPLTEI